MKITPFYPIRANTQNYKNLPYTGKSYYSTPNQLGIVSFQSNNQNSLTKTDSYCAEYFSAPIKKLEDKRAFDQWAREKFYEISDLNLYYSKFAPDNIDRICRLDDWKEHLKKRLLQKNPSLSLIILDSITSPLKPNNHEQPPILNTIIFNNVVKHLEDNENLSSTNNVQKTFKKLYEATLRHYIITNDTTVGKKDTCWITIPSKRTNTKEFKDNLTKLKILSNHGWCTKSTHTETYLKDYDCSIYLKDGIPKLIILSQDNNIKKIQCGIDNNIISYKYAETIDEFIKNNKLNLGRSDEKLLTEAINRKKDFLELKEILKDDITNNNQINIFNKVGISANKNPNGEIIISHYSQPNTGFTFKDLGIDENKLLKNVVEIKGNGDFIHSNLTIANELRKIGKDANFMYSKIKSLNNLEYIGGLANFLQANNLKILPKLSNVGEKLAISSNIELPIFKNLNKLYF